MYIFKYRPLMGSVKLRKKFSFYNGLKVKIKRKFDLDAAIYVHFVKIICTVSTKPNSFD